MPTIALVENPDILAKSSPAEPAAVRRLRCREPQLAEYAQKKREKKKFR